MLDTAWRTVQKPKDVHCKGTRTKANAAEGGQCGEGREAAKAKGKREAAGQGMLQCGCERAQRSQKVNGDVGAFAVAVAPQDLHSHALLLRTIVEALSCPDAARWQAAIDEELASSWAFGT